MDHEDHEDHKEPAQTSAHIETVGREVVDAAIKVHRLLGPGLLESTYEHCLAHELHVRGLTVDRQLALPIEFDGLRLDAGYRLDLVVADSVIVEVKAAEALSRLHEAQILTYLKLSGFRLGYLMNFNCVQLRHGLRRFVR